MKRIHEAIMDLRERARRRGYDLPRVSVREGTSASFPAHRDFAYCTSECPPCIVVAPKLANARMRRILGVLAHEFGHASLIAQGREHSEREADREAQHLFGITIGYDGAEVETARGGTPRRPSHLPR